MRIGIAGAGVIGRLRAKTVLENPKTTLVAVFDPSREAAVVAAGGSGAHVVTNLATFLQTDLDAVIVSSPVHYHEEICLGAFDTGRHVLCEKPLSNSVGSCRRIVQRAQETRKALAVGFNVRYYPSMKFVKDVVDSGRIGTIDHVRIIAGHDGLANFRADWQFRAPESGGGALMDIGIHATDLVGYLLGDITQVFGVASESVWQVAGSEDNAIAVLRNANGIPASYHATWIEWTGYRMVIEAYGNLGMVRGSYAPMRNLLITHDRPGGARRTIRKLYPEVMVREKLFSWEATALLSFQEELEDFVAMTNGRPHGRLADGSAGLRAVEVAEAVRQSGASGQSVSLPRLSR